MFYFPDNKPQSKQLHKQLAKKYIRWHEKKKQKGT